MANWCSNYVTIGVDNTIDGAKRFQHLLELFESKANIHSKRGHGLSLFGSYVFSLQPNDAQDNEDCIQMLYESEWSPIESESFVKLLEKFPCITRVDISYEEPGVGVYGKMVIDNEDGDIGVSIEKAPAFYEHAVSMKDSACEGQYVSLEDAAERNGITVKEVEAVISNTKCALEDFHEDMECFDVDDFI